MLINPLDIFPRHSFIDIDILVAAWQVVGKWKRCHGILEAPQKSDLHGLAAVMAYIMEFMACGGLLPLARQDFGKMPVPDWLTKLQTPQL